MYAEGRSAVWGGLTFAVFAGVVAFVVALVAGWNAQLTALRSTAVVYTLMALMGLVGWVDSRRNGRTAPIAEPIGDVILSATLIWVAFAVQLDLLHSLGWIFVGLMAFAILEGIHGWLVRSAQVAALRAENQAQVQAGQLGEDFAGLLATEHRRAGRISLAIPVVELAIAAAVIVLLAR